MNQAVQMLGGFGKVMKIFKSLDKNGDGQVNTFLTLKG